MADLWPGTSRAPFCAMVRRQDRQEPRLRHMAALAALAAVLLLAFVATASAREGGQKTPATRSCDQPARALPKTPR